MANNLTGDFEAVLQVTIRQINGILATIHQNKIDPAVSPSFVHSASMRIGSSPLSTVADVVRFKGWMVEALAGKIQPPKPFAQSIEAIVTEPRRVLSANAPPGLKDLFESAFGKIDLSLIEAFPPEAVHGLAHVQVSNPSISMPPGFVSRVMVHAFVRAHYEPDPGTAPLPKPIHGEVRAVYVLEPRTLSDGRRIVRVHASNGARDVQFIPAPGTIGGLDVETITEQVRTLLQTKFAPLDVSVDNDFAFSDVSAVGAGPQQALVLPLALSGGEAAGAIGSVVNSFLAGHEFAVAVSRGYVDTFFNQFVQAIKDSAKTTIETFFADYEVSVSSLGLNWKAGYLELAGHISLTTDAWFAPNGYISFTQNLGVHLDVVAQSLSLVALGDPTVDESWWVPHSTAVNAVKKARDSGLPTASASLNNNTKKARAKLNSALHSFDKTTDARYDAVEVTPDGLVLRGNIRTDGRIDPVVHYAQKSDGTYTAHRSWIPGGRIENFTWSWVEQTSPIPWFNKTSSVGDDHRFELPKPAGLDNAPRLCLMIRGIRLNHNGVEEAVVGGDYCTVSAYEPILTAPIWYGRVMLPIWWPDPPDQVLDHWIVAHINVLADRPSDRPTYNGLVHFVGSRDQRPLESIGRALSMVRRQDATMVVTLVLPAGSFGARREELERRLGNVGERFGAALQITEDYAGGWTQLFAPREATSTHLLNARGALVWGRDGNAEPDEIANAIETHALTSAPPQRVPFTLSLQPGQRLPDQLFVDQVGNQVAMRRLSGRRVLLSFWQSWSTPCIQELQYLERLSKGEGAPYVLAVNGGESIETVTETQHRYGLSLPLIVDPDQRIAAEFGVKCWPTTISVNRQGIVDRIQFGMSRAIRQQPAESAY